MNEEEFETLKKLSREKLLADFDEWCKVAPATYWDSRTTPDDMLDIFWENY